MNRAEFNTLSETVTGAAPIPSITLDALENKAPRTLLLGMLRSHGVMLHIFVHDNAIQAVTYQDDKDNPPLEKFDINTELEKHLPRLEVDAAWSDFEFCKLLNQKLVFYAIEYTADEPVELGEDATEEDLYFGHINNGENDD